MNNSTANILTLSDEILLKILSKLNNMDVLYSLIGVNRKLDRVARDTTFTQSLDLARILSVDANDVKTNLIFDRFCSYIIPRIQHHIVCFTLDLFSIDHVLRIGNYPQLHKLILLNLQYDIISQMFNDKSATIHIFQDQISHLTIMINDDCVNEQRRELSRKIFTNVFVMFTNLTYLHFDFQDYCQYLPTSVVNLPSTACYSSNIVHLNVKILDFDVCLYLLDGRLSQLHTFIVHVYCIRRTSMINKNMKIVSNLKCFSLISFRRTTEYDNLIVPFVGQMFNLEELTLSLVVYDRESFVDSTELVHDILSPMFNLHRFIFNIITEGVTMSEELFQPPDVISHALVERGYDLVCYTDYNVFSKGHCHIYSLPFTMDRMRIHSSKFPGGLFLTVRYLSVQDFFYPFEHEFFLRISQAFPLLKQLAMFNVSPQKKKVIQEQQDEDEQISSIIEFPHLIKLGLRGSYIDYAKQFLFDYNTRLPSLHTLDIKYECLVIVTENFTNNTARANCAKLQHLIFDSIPMIYPENFFLYFPLL